MKTKLKNLLLGLLLSLPFLGKSQDVASVELEQVSWWKAMMQSEQGQYLLLIAAFLLTLIVLLIIMVILLARTANLITGANKKDELSWTAQLKQKWITGKLKPVGQEGDMLLDHNYDGIQEMDYGMPPWLRYVFMGTIAFAAFYIPAFLIFDIIPDQQTELDAQYEHAALLAEARAKAGMMAITAETAELSSDAAVLEAGNAIFQQNCSVCHAKDGGGGVGPNLTDNYWIHGSDISGVFKTVSEGVPSKGMIPWKGKLNPKDIQDVSNYVLSLVGTNPVNPKEPQGEAVQAKESEEQNMDAEITNETDNQGF